ncbi:MAG: fluoride exporter [Frankiaceae bacterium]|jgi:CrcB protein|nr:fluoride exporter [Frankiaceae bacterium]
MPLTETRRVALVAAGGAVGAFARWRLALAAPVAAGAFPLTTFLVNAGGAGLLGYLVGRVPVRDPRSEAVRLALGTGVLGGFTTFSTFAVEVARRTAHGHADTAVTYAVLSVVAGVVAAVVGLALGAAAGSAE